ncbi:autotransporter assembly complex protein TamA [Psychrobacter sp. DM4]|uniref:autotransporter assembly complex protein TamA n=1 Tax=Psychrobacter sp. DM4 TaxID=3440637 RepID=UPI003F4F4FB6
MLRHQPLAPHHLPPKRSSVQFTRTALFSALAASLVGFGIAPAQAAESTSNTNSSMAAAEDAQLDRALEALRLQQEAEQGEVDQSVLTEFNRRNAANTNNDAPPQSADTATTSDSNNALDISDSIFDNSDMSPTSNELLEQQAASVQQQGYQMMTPEQIERELAALDAPMDMINGASTGSANSDGINSRNFDTDFDAPVATLDSTRAPVGFDTELDAANLPTPTNLDTLNREESAADRAKTAEILARPINVSDAVGSGRVDARDDITQQTNPERMLANQDGNRVTGANNTIAEVTEEARTGQLLETIDNQTDDLNPDDYLPDYQAATETEAVSESIVQADANKPKALSSGNFIKRTYNRLFNGGVSGLPHIETTVYLQQGSDTLQGGSTSPRLIEADEDIQPINNIKAALDDTTVQSVVDFTAALPRLRQSALDAAKAVGYYDVVLSLRQPSPDRIDVIIERLGEPVRVDNRIVEVRGEGIDLPEFQALQDELPPKEGDIFNHRVYKSSKAALEALSSTYGYFDQYWLNKSVDIILPDNTADVSLVYDTGERYEFDEVIFFTYDKESGTLTRDPDKLPVELSLLRQLYNFREGDPFYRPDITKFSNDLSATRYFNTVNVESILPPDERTQNSTLAFDNAPTTDGSLDNNGLDNDVDSDNNSAGNEGSVLNAGSNNSEDTANSDGVGSESMNAGSGATVDEEDIAPIEFEVDEQTNEKLQAIKQKAERLTQLPNDRVLDEKEEKAENILGKISDSFSNIVEKVFPDDKSVLEDENFVPPTLAGRIAPEQVLETKKVPLYVFVSSENPRDAEVGIGYGTDTGVRATARIDYNLINRQGYQAGAEVEYSRITKNATIYGSRPWKHPLNDKLEARLTYEEEVIDQGEGNFDLSTRTLKAALARNIRRENGWNRSYFVKYRLDELETGVNDADLEDLPIRFISSKPTQEALLFGYGINKTDVDNVLNPTRGLRQYYSIEAGSEDVLSDTDMAIIKAGVSGLYSFGEDDKHQLLGRFNTGYIWADNFEGVPYKLRFFAGGDQSIRGYDYESLSPLRNGYLTGGQVLAVGSAEYNYEFRPGFRGALFTDIGNAYDTDFDTETKVGVGVGIRWASPVGVVRVDVAAGVTEDSVPVRLHFFIGSPL